MRSANSAGAAASESFAENPSRVMRARVLADILLF
jgi:hypothetical protein